MSNQLQALDQKHAKVIIEKHKPMIVGLHSVFPIPLTLFCLHTFAFTEWHLLFIFQPVIGLVAGFLIVGLIVAIILKIYGNQVECIIRRGLGKLPMVYFSYTDSIIIIMIQLACGRLG